MSTAATSYKPSSTRSHRLSKPHHHRLFTPSHPTSISLRPIPTAKTLSWSHSRNLLPVLSFSASDNHNGGFNNNSGGGGGGNDGDGNSGGGEGDKNKAEAILVLAELGRSMESLPKDLAAAIEGGRIPGSIVSRYLELEKSAFMRWLLQFGGFKERLLADDLFLAKVGIECGVGMFTKTAAEYERRRENFFKELEIVFADVVMAIIADFMLVYLPAPTVSLRGPISLSAGRITKFFYGCPDNAFQVALAGTSYSFLQRLGAIARNGAKLFGVGTVSSLVGTVVTNTLINAKKAVQTSSEEELENVPVLSTSVAYGVYMAISSNLRVRHSERPEAFIRWAAVWQTCFWRCRDNNQLSLMVKVLGNVKNIWYQVLAGVIEQRLLEPMLHQHKLILSAICFAVRTGNTFLGSLLWVDCARLIGIQKAQEVE